jgi:hypothetical protein
MKTRSILFFIATSILLALQGCTTLSSSSDSIIAHTDIPSENPMLDHYIAWVPRDQAQTATVAEAMAHISLVNAREQTASELCAGQWMMQGKVAENLGPLPARAPESAGGYHAWYYRISHLPGIQGCSNTDSRTLYHAMQKNLPDWINIKAATTTTLGLLD